MAWAGHQRHILVSVKEMLVTMSCQMSSKDICLALVYAPNKQTAELEREPSCSIVSQLAVRQIGVFDHKNCDTTS
jgi:hypothetical protein